MQVVAEYMRANALLKPSAASTHVWGTLYQEIEKVLNQGSMLGAWSH